MLWRTRRRVNPWHQLRCRRVVALLVCAAAEWPRIHDRSRRHTRTDTRARASDAIGVCSLAGCRGLARHHPLFVRPASAVHARRPRLELLRRHGLGITLSATVLPVSHAWPVAMASGLLFGAVFLSVVASTTALVRHNLPAAQWVTGISAFTIAFALGQIVGPTVAGWISVGGCVARVNAEAVDALSAAPAALPLT